MALNCAETNNRGFRLRLREDWTTFIDGNGEQYRFVRIFAEEIEASPARWAMVFRSSMMKDLQSFRNLDGSRVIYSLWPGYLDKDRSDLRAWCASRHLAFEIQHCSGHASIGDLGGMVESVAPRRLVPIHTHDPHRFLSLFANTELHPNGEWVEVAR